MKLRRFIMLLSFPAVALACPPAYSQAVSGPRIFLPERHHDFKEVKEGAEIEHTFTVQNQGDEVLEIRRVNPG